MLPQTRRAALRSIAGMSALAVMGGCAGPMRATGMTAPRKLGIQLYMLGDEVGNALDETLRQVADIGYREVELPHFYNREPSVLARAIGDAGLTCPSIHVTLDPLWPNMPTLRDMGLIADAAATLGANHIVVPIFPVPEKLARPMRENETSGQLISDIASKMTVADWRDIAGKLNDAGATLGRRGLKLSYHNHNVEFVKMADGRTAFDVLVAETDPAQVGLELDLGWVAAAGLDPVAMVERYASRIRQVHMRDLKPTPPNTEIFMNPADLGQGTMDWKRLLPALERAGVEHFYVEQDPPFASSRMNSAKVAFEFLQPAFANAM